MQILDIADMTTMVNNLCVVLELTPVQYASLLSQQPKRCVEFARKLLQDLVQDPAFPAPESLERVIVTNRGQVQALLPNRSGSNFEFPHFLMVRQ